MIVDLEPAARARSAGWLLMPLALGALTVGLVAVALRPPDPESAALARARVLAALPSPVPTETPAPLPVAGLLGPSVLAQRTPLPTLPPLLALPREIASPIAGESADARREIHFTPSDLSRPAVYRLPDGRMFVLHQMVPGRGRPVLVTYGLEEGTVRGLPAELLASSVGPFRALVWWTEGPAAYYLYSSTVTLRELVRIADQLR